jgi:anti-anti-sigma regulatory factor
MLEEHNMLKITMPLSPATVADHALCAEWRSVAMVDLDLYGKEKRVNITLRGAIAGESANSLLDFLKAVSGFVATRWTLQMQDLRILSVQGTRSLIRFAKIMRKRGHEVEVRGIHRNVYATLLESGYDQVFAWAD